MAQAPTPTIALTFSPEFAEVRSDVEVALTFNLHLQAPEMREEAAEGAGRSVVSLSSVLDKSGSMGGQKLALVKRASDFMVTQLGSRDKLGVVQYDSQVNELIPLSRTSAAFKTESKRMIASIEAGSCTNLSGGLFQGMQQQIDNTYVDWDTDEASTGPAPTAPSAPPSDTSSVVHVDDAASDVSDADSIAVPTAVPLGSPSEEPHGVVAGLASLFGRMTRRRQPRPNWSPPAAPQPSHPSGHTVRAAQPRVSRRRAHFEPPALFGGREAPAKQDVEDDAVRSVFLFTDGQANEGITDERQLVSMVQKMADQKHRVRVYTFGFGSDHSEELLSKLAQAGSGSYYFIEKEDNIATAFADALGGLLSVAAQNVKLTFVPAPGVAVDEVHTSFATTQEGGGGRSVRVGDLLSEEAKDTLLDVRLPALANLAEGQSVDFKVGHVEVSFLDVETASTKSLHVDCVVRRSRHATHDPATGNRSVSVQRARMETVRALEQSRAHADAGQYAASRQCLTALDARLATLVESARAANDGASAALAQVLRDDVSQAQEDTSTETVWHSKGKKKMEMKISSRSAQRCVRADSDDDEAEQLDTWQELHAAAEGGGSSARGVSQFRSGTKMQQKMRFMSKSFR